MENLELLKEFDLVERNATEYNEQDIEKLALYKALKSIKTDCNVFDELWYFIRDLDLNDVKDIEDFADRVIEYYQDSNLLSVEIIYHHKALSYLLENDPSLQYSVEIASDYWYETKNLNSELLASLLATRNNEESFYEWIEEVKLLDFNF